MACGLPVVASPVDANCDVVEEGVTGLFADSFDDWRSALTRLAGDPALRERMGRAGRARVERDYAMKAAGDRLAALFRDIAAGGTA